MSKGYPINTETLMQYTELKANGKKLDMTYHFDLRGEPICVGDLAMVAQENHKGETEQGLYRVGKSKYGHYILIATHRSDIKLDLNAFMYWRGIILKQDIEVVAKSINHNTL